MKEIIFLGNTLECLQGFPDNIRQRAGYELYQVQCGKMPSDFKPMATIGSGVVEIRLRDETGAWRVIYTAKIANTIFVLHAFQKKTQKTAKSDIDLAKSRFKQIFQVLQEQNQD